MSVVNTNKIVEVINIIDNIFNLNEKNDTFNLDQRLYIFIYNYKKWIDDEKNEYNKTLSPIIILCMFKKYLNNNSHSLLISNSLLNYFNEYIDKKSRYYYLSSKYKNKWLYKYINKKEPTNLYDLELNTINPLKYYINYIDYKERKRYLFTINDFKKIACSSLEHCCSYDIIPDPIAIKNPYTNKEFTSSELDQINKKLYDMPPIWNMFVDSKFNISTLRKKYYYHLIPLCIPSYVHQLNDIDIIEYLEDICNEYNINYCEQCLLRDHKDVSTQKIKNVVIEWIKCITFNKIMSREIIEQINNTYGLLYCHHNRPFINNKENEKEEEKNIEFNLDFTKPLFCIGYKDKNDKKLYIKKQKEKYRKLKRIDNRNKVKNV
jgi:hypothetical protein